MNISEGPSLVLIYKGQVTFLKPSLVFTQHFTLYFFIYVDSFWVVAGYNISQVNRHKQNMGDRGVIIDQ